MEKVDDMLKILSAGLIATAMFTTAASARENPTNEGHAAERAQHASVLPFADGAGRLWMAAPSVGTAEPSEQPGGICDDGDNPQIC
jgi:hypothetical protein